MSLAGSAASRDNRWPAFEHLAGTHESPPTLDRVEACFSQYVMPIRKLASLAPMREKNRKSRLKSALNRSNQEGDRGLCLGEHQRPRPSSRLCGKVRRPYGGAGIRF